MFATPTRPEILLSGGEVTGGVVRLGDTVRRPVRPCTPAVHALLRHLESAGFDGAPRVLGIDGQGREMLSYLTGEAGTAPLRPYMVTDESLIALAVLLRRCHDAVAGFESPPGAVWETGSRDDAAPELIGHCDITLENVIFRNQTPWALIDFDMARPTTRLFDVVTTLRHWAPIADPLDRDPLQRGLDVGARMRLFCDEYGLGRAERRRVLDVARVRFDRSYAAMQAKAATLGGGWNRMWSSGAGERIRRARGWLDAHEDDLAAHLR